MDPETGTPVVTRGRILAVAALAAFAWLILTLFGVSTPATADDGGADDDSLLGALTAEINDVSAVPIDEPLTTAVAQVTESLEPVVASVADPVVTDLAEPVVAHMVEPVLNRPLAAETVNLVDQLLTHGAPSPELILPFTDEPLISAPTTSGVVVAAQPEPVAVALTSAASDTKAAHVPAAGSHPIPIQPRTPTGPELALAPSLTQNAGAPALLAAMPASLNQFVLVGSPAAAENLTPPAAPTFDSDTSPD
jgi:hypothetical protein